MEKPESAEPLKRAILETARRESAGLLAAAEAEAGAIVSAARELALGDRAARLAAARAEAARRRETALAAAPAAAERLRARRTEDLLDSIKEEALGRLKAETAAGVQAALAAQAVSRMEGTTFTVTLGAGGRAAAGGLAAEIERLAGRGPLAISFEEDPGLEGGVRVRDGEERQYWDNSFKARLERFWPALRGRLLPGGDNGRGRKI